MSSLLAAQEYKPPTTTGTVSSMTKNQLTVRTEEGKYFVFVFDRNTTKPDMIAVGTPVRVQWTPTQDPDVRLADVVTILTPAGTPAQPDVVPQEVRNIEKAIEREAQLFRLGFRGGFTLDPELVEIGAHMEMGPFFRVLTFRPNVEFAYGELTTMFAINPEVTFRAPFGPRNIRWFYFGVGPGLNFVERSFSNTSGNAKISFSDFNYSTSFNILAGMQYRSGWFMELKTSIWAGQAPVLHLLVGYTF